MSRSVKAPHQPLKEPVTGRDQDEEGKDENDVLLDTPKKLRDKDLGSDPT